MTEDTWSETAQVSIAQLDGSDVEFACITETIDLDIGDKDFDSIPTVKGGRVNKFNPQEPTSITLEAYPVEMGTASGTEGNGFLDLLHTGDAIQPLSITNDHTRTKTRMIVTWSNNAMSTAAGAITGSYEGARIIAKDGYVTSAKPSFTDGVLKYTVTYKTGAFNKAAESNVTYESTDGTEDLAAVAAYT